MSPMGDVDSEALLELLIDAKGPSWVIRQLADHSADSHWEFSEGMWDGHRPLLFITGSDASDAYRVLHAASHGGESDE